MFASARHPRTGAPARGLRALMAAALLLCLAARAPAVAADVCPAREAHQYLGNYPGNRENGWSDEAQGVAHDDGHWFFTQKDWLLKFPVDFDLNTGIASFSLFHPDDLQHRRASPRNLN